MAMKGREQKEPNFLSRVAEEIREIERSGFREVLGNYRNCFGGLYRISLGDEAKGVVIWWRRSYPLGLHLTG
ncbi:Hypothetical predicted protein [Olea europaea subsp. europaea]|uniref:Uncharacterized protein n=1 Tax=Olea europaea subsp. europaea TaxID=158383 RepID=A0A8S0PE60_OLEEU|nr:Hypothetical predicted protein [Olea europaea subsp. europaea]